MGSFIWIDFGYIMDDCVTVSDISGIVRSPYTPVWVSCWAHVYCQLNVERSCLGGALKDFVGCRFSVISLNLNVIKAFGTKPLCAFCRRVDTSTKCT